MKPSADHRGSSSGLKPKRAYIGLGSNLGDRAGQLAAARMRLAELGALTAFSSLYETEPVGFTDQPRFLNQVVALDSGRSPRGLLRALKQIERALGRAPGGPRFGPRGIDLDLLLYGDMILDLPARPGWLPLKLPHPRMHERAFVLTPLAEIAPGLRHPVLDRTMRALAAGAEPAGVRRLAH